MFWCAFYFFFLTNTTINQKEKNLIMIVVSINMERNSKILKLRDAVEIYKKEKRAISNSYNWYRKSAKKNGAMFIGNYQIPAITIKRKWYVDKDKFEKAIEHHRNENRHRDQMTKDYKQGIIHGEDGDTITTEWGGYRIQIGFRFEWSDYLIARGKSNGRWICNTCNIHAKTENNKEECHLCRDWNGCGNNCTLSKVYCPNCGEQIDF